MWLDRNELVSLDLKLTSDYGDIIPKIQIGYDLFNLIEHNTSIDTETKINLKEKAVICHQKIRIRISGNMTDATELKLIHYSITGMYKKEEDLLHM